MLSGNGLGSLWAPVVKLTSQECSTAEGTLSLHSYCTVVTLLLHSRHTVVTLLLHCWCTGVILLQHFCDTVYFSGKGGSQQHVYAGEVEVLSANTALLRIPDPGTLSLHCCHTVVTLFIHCCYTVVTFLIHSCHSLTP
jgi:hypothetical protein